MDGSTPRLRLRRRSSHHRHRQLALPCRLPHQRPPLRVHYHLPPLGEVHLSRRRQQAHHLPERRQQEQPPLLPPLLPRQHGLPRLPLPRAPADRC